LGAQCGMLADGCGQTIDCGGCTAPDVCGGGGQPNQCGCTKTTCAVQQACGTIPDGCGGTIDCGPCAITCASVVSCTPGDGCCPSGCNSSNDADCPPPPAIVTLAWDAPTTHVDGSPLTDLRGYKLHYGTLSGTYGATVDVGSQTTYTVNGLQRGNT